MVLQITAEAAFARRLSSRDTANPSGPIPGGGIGGGASGGTGIQTDANSNAAHTKMWQARLQQRRATTLSSGVGLSAATTGFAPPAGSVMAPPTGMLAPLPALGSSMQMPRADSIDFVSPAIPRSTSLGDMDSRLVEQLGLALHQKGKLDEVKRFVQSQHEAGVMKKERVTKLLTKLVALLGVEVVVAATNEVVESTDVEGMLLKTLKDRLTRSQRSTFEKSISAYRTHGAMDHIKFIQSQVNEAVVVQSLCEVRTKRKLRKVQCLVQPVILTLSS